MLGELILRRIMHVVFLLALPCCCSISFQSSAQQPVILTRILFLLDGSSSMNEAWSNTLKVEAASRIISQIADSLNASGDVQLALRIYGHQSNISEHDCADTKLEVPFASHNAAGIKNALRAFHPRGITPIANSLEQAANDFPNDVRSRNIVILLTDGEESCEGDPCAVSLKLQQRGIVLRPFIVGLNLTPATSERMDCIGNYYNAANPEALRSIMKTTIDRVLSSAAVQVNLLDSESRPLETDVSMTFSHEVGGAARYQFYHTITNSGSPDTMELDPVPVYLLKVHTTPPLVRDQLSFSAHYTDTINIPAPQGMLRLELEGKTINQNLNDKIRVLVRKSGSDETIQVQKLYETMKYLCGRYDLEVLTLPRITIRNVAITQSSTTTISIPIPGIASISKSFAGVGSVMMKQGDKWVKIYQLRENSNSELIGLQAGEYELVFRSKFAKRTAETIVKRVTIKSGVTTTIKL